MSSNNNSPFSAFVPVLEMLGKALGPTIMEAFNPRAGKTPSTENGEIAGIVTNMLRALAGKPTAGSWHARRTPNAHGVVHQVYAGEVEVAGQAMSEADAQFISAVNPEAVSKLLIWHAAREEAKASKAEVSGALLEKLHSGDRLSDEEIIALVRHFRALEAMVSPMGATWRLAGDAVRRELIRSEDLLRARNLSA